MVTHDVSQEFYGLVHESEAEAFALDESQLVIGSPAELPSDLVLNFMRHRMHGDSGIAHLPGLADTGTLMLSQNETSTSEVFSFRYRLKLPGARLVHEATSIIVPHDTRVPRLVETHRYRFAHNELSEELPRPASSRQYKIFRHVGHAASLMQTLRIAS